MKLLILVLLLSVDIVTGQNDSTTEETTTLSTTELPTSTVTTTTTASTTAGSTETTSAETTAASTFTTEPTGFTSNSSSSDETTEPVTTESTSSTGSTATTTASTVTTVQPIGQQNFSCVDGNVTRFSLVGSFALAITYNTNKTGVQTVQINVPETANSQPRCDGNSSTESIQFQFFSGWSIELVFAEELSLAKQVGVSSKYFVSNITVAYVHDDHLPDSATQGLAVKVPWAAPKDYLATSGDKFYSCKSEVKQSLNGQVEVRTTNFKYKAFNEEGDIDWNSGSINECSADEETSSVVPIAVGAALAGLVVIVLIAYLIGRRRARKAGYESV